MDRTIFDRRIPASHKLRMLAAAALTALALSACGGGGGGGGTGTSGPSLTAGGVTAGVEYDTASSAPSLSIKKGSTAWEASPPAADVQAAPSGWASSTRINADSGSETERFRVVAKIASASDDDYLAYGYWNRHPLDDLDDYKPFYYGKTPYTGNVVERTGSVTYTGGATGVYQTDANVGTTAVAGRFTADVTLTVSFGTTSSEAPGLRLGMSNIATRTSAGTATGPELSDIASTDLTATATAPSFTGTGANIGARWGGQFYGPSSGVPTGIVGWFKTVSAVYAGSTKTAVLHGTFGAKKE